MSEKEIQEFIDSIVKSKNLNPEKMESDIIKLLQKNLEVVE